MNLKKTLRDGGRGISGGSSRTSNGGGVAGSQGG